VDLYFIYFIKNNLDKSTKENCYSGRVIIKNIYLAFIKIRLQQIFEYRGAFFSGVFAQLLFYGTSFFLTWIMVNHFKTLNGWTPYEVLFLFSLNLLSYSISAFFIFSSFINLSQLIQSGDFDTVYIKPMNPFLFLIFSNFNVGYFSHFTLSSIVMVLCIIKTGISMTVINVIMLILVLLGASLIQAAAMMFTSIPSFWLIRTNTLPVVFFSELKKFIQYPLSLYGTAVQVFFTLIIPYAFINFYPAQFFLGKKDFLIFHPVFQYLTPAVGILLFFLAYRFWLFGLKNYASTGS
jgi:ABC-2 type transport system permease protein